MSPDPCRMRFDQMEVLPSKTLRHCPTKLFHPHQRDSANNSTAQQILSGIYYTANLSYWTTEKLIANRFKNVIVIDKIGGNHKHIADDDDERLRRLDLNFGEFSYLTSVLPNCYKAVKFMDNAFRRGERVLILEQNDNQKCVTIVVGFLMFKYQWNFTDAFQRLTKILPNARLDPFFVSQLNEYEPILQVQHSLTHTGHSCSGEHRRAMLKRKQTPVPSYGDINSLGGIANYSNSYREPIIDVSME